MPGDALVPPRDDPARAEREPERRVALPRRVELLAGRMGDADVVHVDGVARARLRAVADGDVLHDELGRGRSVDGVDVGSLQGHGLSSGSSASHSPCQNRRRRVDKGSVTDAATAADPTSGYEPDPRRWKALTVTLVAGFMSLLDVSIVAVALPSIQRGLGTSPSAVQWVVSGYALTFGLALVPAGRLGDAIGRRTMFLAALAAFVLCSAAAGAAPTTGVLVAARLAQGIAAGSLAPQNSALIQQLFRGAERGRAFGFFGSTVGISTAVGPIVGGVILAVAGEPDGWRWIFFVNVPIGVVALVLAARLIPRTEPWAARARGPRRRRPARRRRAGADAPAGAGRGRWPGPAVVAVPAGRGRAGRLRPLGAARRGRRSPAAAGRPAAHRHPRLRLGRAARHGLLRRVQRDLAGVRAVPAVGAGLHAAAVGAGRDAVRARLGGVGGRRRTPRRAMGPRV